MTNKQQIEKLVEYEPKALCDFLISIFNIK